MQPCNLVISKMDEEEEKEEEEKDWIQAFDQLHLSKWETEQANDDLERHLIMIKLALYPLIRTIVKRVQVIYYIERIINIHKEIMIKDPWQIYNTMTDLDAIVNLNTPENVRIALKTVCDQDKKYFNITKVLFDDVEVHILYII